MKGIEKSLYFMFGEEGWPRKMGFGALYMFLALFAVGIPFVAGYFIEVVRRSMNQDSPLLPEWDRMREKFLEGIQVSAICFIYAAPALLLVSYVRMLIGDAGGVALGCWWILAIVFWIVSFLFVVQVIATYVREGSLEPCIQVGDLIDSIFRNVKEYFILILLAIVAMIIVGIVSTVFGKLISGPLGNLITWIISLAVVFWSNIMIAHGIGVTQRLPEPAPEDAPSPSVEVVEPPEDESID